MFSIQKDNLKNMHKLISRITKQEKEISIQTTVKVMRVRPPSLPQYQTIHSILKAKSLYSSGMLKPETSAEEKF